MLQGKSLQGGSLEKNDVFQKILSIGYEFETHDITKLSLHKNGTTLINSDLTLRLLKEKMDVNSVKIVDDNYLHVRIPIQRGGKSEPDASSSLSELEELEDLEKEFMEAFEEEYELEQKENDNYFEYFNENRKGDKKEKIKFQNTNDVGDGDFGELVNKYCKDLTIPKNDMYFFQDHNQDKMYDIKFSEKLAESSCKTFTGVEFVITYYSALKFSGENSNPNIILDTFVDACSRIIDHFGDLEKKSGSLLIATEDSQDSQDSHSVNHKIVIGLNQTRHLYHKPNTNLYYLDTYDDLDWTDKKSTRALLDAVFIPQMTFRCKAIHAIDIMKQMVVTHDDPSIKVGKKIIKGHQKEYADIVMIETMVDQLFTHYMATTSKTQEKKPRKNSAAYHKIKCYTFLIFYKLYYYIQEHVDILSEDSQEQTYLKDYLSFSSRHTNYDLYREIQRIFKEYYGITNTKQIHDFFVQPNILRPLYDLPTFREEDFNGSGEFIYGDALSTKLEKQDEHYGDPLYSIRSYFDHFENPTSKYERDWLVSGKIDIYSTTFEMKNDTLLLENRYFKQEVGLWLRNHVDKKIHQDQLSLREMHTIVKKLYGNKNIKKMMNLELNPKTHRFTRKIDRFDRFKRKTRNFRKKV